MEGRLSLRRALGDYPPEMMIHAITLRTNASVRRATSARSKSAVTMWPEFGHDRDLDISRAKRTRKARRVGSTGADLVERSVNDEGRARTRGSRPARAPARETSTALFMGVAS